MPMDTSLMRALPRLVATTLVALPLLAVGACSEDVSSPAARTDPDAGAADGAAATEGGVHVDASGDGGSNGTDPWTSFASGTTEDLFAIWGTSASDVWAVGDKGAVTHFDGTSWKVMDSTVQTKLTSVHGTSASDVWAVGEEGTAIHFDGTAWSTKETGISYEDLNCVWAVDASDVWAVGGSVFGSEGYIAHFDGASWSVTTTGRGLGGVWASAKDDVWIVGGRTMAGEDGVILHKTTGDFETLPSRQQMFLTAIMGSSPTKLWIVGGNLNTATTVTGDGTPTSWTGLDHRPGSMLSDVWTHGDDVWAVGGSGSTNIMHVRLGTKTGWDPITVPDEGPAVSAVWGTDDGSIWLAGAAGTIRRHRP